MNKQSRMLKVPITIHISPKKYCVNNSRLERDLRKRVRDINKYTRSIHRKIERELKNIDLMEVS
jgi:hypothetical protein